MTGTSTLIPSRHPGALGGPTARSGIVLVYTALTLAVGSVAGASPTTVTVQVTSPPEERTDLLRVLGDGVVGSSEQAVPLSGVSTLAGWETGEWQYRITSGPRRGQIEVESVAPIGASARDETWKRTIGRESTLYLRETGDGSLVLPSQITHPHRAVVYFEPPLIYLMAGMAPGEAQRFEGRMDVHSANNPAVKWYSGTIRATTVYAGVYRITTPAGAFQASLIKTEYEIDILSVVSVRDTLYTFYAPGVGKVAEAEHRRITAAGVFRSDTKTGKVLLAYPALSRPIDTQQAP